MTAASAASHRETFGGDLSTVGGMAATGAGLGLLGGPFAEVTAPVGGPIGAGLGGAVVGVRRIHAALSHDAPAATPAGGVVQQINTPAGAIIVQNPTSNVDVEQAFRDYFASRAQRGVPVPPGVAP